MTFEQTQATIQSLQERGLLKGLQIYVSRSGKVLLDAGFGEARPGVPMDSETILPWLSAGKPITAAAILKLVDRGEIGLDEPVCKYIPEFGVGGKQDISLRHLLTHTAGFRDVPLHWPHGSWNDTIDAICHWPLEPNWIVGKTAGYHIASSWYVLGELIRRIDGRQPSDFLNEEVFQPLGMRDCWNGMPGDDWKSMRQRLGIMWNRERDVLSELPWHDELHCSACSPGGNTRGPIRELGKFYETALAGRLTESVNSSPFLSRELWHLMTTPQRIGSMDLTLQHVVDFGLGLIVDSKQYGPNTVPYTYGSRASAATFGHGGSQSSIGFADPQAGVVVAYVANIRPGEAWHQRRHRELVEAIWDDMDRIL